MVGLFVVAIAVLTLVILVLFAYWMPGPDQGRAGTPPGAHESEHW